jgi:hypothetical protein
MEEKKQSQTKSKTKVKKKNTKNFTFKNKMNQNNCLNRSEPVPRRGIFRKTLLLCGVG